MLLNKKIAALFFLSFFINHSFASNADSTEPVRHMPSTFKFAHFRSSPDLYFLGNTVSEQGRSLKAMAGFSRQGRPVPIHYFQGKTERRALVIGGVHGTELSAIDVAYELIDKMNTAIDTPEFSVLIIPELFPDNANAARKNPSFIGSPLNIGRYTVSGAADPNRQMPALGMPFLDWNPVDARGREIEPENRMLLRLIQEYAPERIVNLHAIREQNMAGVYADPRTDHQLIAKGFAYDSTLAIMMAGYISDSAMSLPGNWHNGKPNALYVHDPEVAPVGTLQKRNTCGACSKTAPGGVSLGGWASTAVNYPQYSREAITIITMEFPGCKRSGDYPDPAQAECTWLLQRAFAGSIRAVFLSYP
jgi:hypothetical protein